MIAIKGMKMPCVCGRCPCFYNGRIFMCCQATTYDPNKIIVDPFGLPRPDWCPLVEVKDEEGEDNE